MKRFVKGSTTAKDVERITIDFYGDIDLTEIEASSTSRRVFKNTQVVIRDVKAYLESKGLTVLSTSKSSNECSDSTYYDIDIRVRSKDGKLKYLYLRVSDHPESALNEEPRNNYHDRKTRNYEGLPDNFDTKDMYYYKSIVVSDKRYNNYDRAMNQVKRLVNEVLEEKGIL